MDHKRLPVVPVVRLSTRLHLTAFFPSPAHGGRRCVSAGSPPALMADVRVVIRRHFPAGPANRVVVEKVAEDISLRRQPSRKLRSPERVERALAADVMPLVRHTFDRRAVVEARKEIAAYVSGACADPRLAKGGVQILVLLDTFACRTLLRPAPALRKPVAAVKNEACARTTEQGVAAVPVKKARDVGVIGDGRPKKVDVQPQVEERFKGWVPW
ncbi:hypothetical protein BRADI_1g63770v3 [Brachypodium distachyon]|uniref:Uncharacterized protein n=1 Tax=Brachypodium distachyon TaxID=15368 RepID=I1H5Z1_BRADI|nr:hypothetical protein BRADI_1g63770v3 [Brachypodium distachyon]